MDKLVTLDGIKKLKSEMQNAIEADRRYHLINSVKCDAIYTAKTYEEFSDRVAAAHLRPLEKSDKIQPGKCIWNNVASKKKKTEESDLRYANN